LHHRFDSAWRKDELDNQLAGELAFHLEQLVNENLREGMPEAAARDDARRKLGNIGAIEEKCRDQRRVRWLHDLRQDLVYGLRLLRSSPSFTAVATVSLAIGIGGNSAILSVADSITRGQLPFPDPDRIVLLRTFPLGNPGQTIQASIPDWLAWKEQNTVFESMGAFIADQRDLGAEEDGLPAERLMGEGVTPGLFDALRVQPLLGRVFTEEEDQIDHPAPVVLISQDLWRRRFHADSNIINRRVRLNGAPVTILGVMPATFRYPLENIDFWAPMGYNRYQLEGSARLFTVTARLKQGVTLAQAQAAMDRLAAELSANYPERHKGWGVRVVSLRSAWFGWMATWLILLGAAVTLVLLIACANVASLLLARSSVRRSEIAMRVALGANRGRIFRQALTESVLLSVAGGILGVFVAWAAVRELGAIAPPYPSQRAVEAGISVRTFGWMGLISLASGIVFGVAPAMAAVKLDLASSLGGSSRGIGERTSARNLHNALVVFQIAVALILLTWAGLLGNSFWRVVSQNLNFDPRGVATFEFRLPLQSYLRGLGTNRGMPYFEINPPSQILQQVHERIAAIPGVEAAAGISLLPVNGILIPTATVLAEGRPAPETEAQRDALRVKYFVVTPNVFATLRAPLLSGREFTNRDTASAPWGAVINESMARRFWPGEDPIGKLFTIEVLSGEQPRQVIGVVRDIPLARLQPDPEPVLYTSYLQQAQLYRGPSGNMFGKMTFLIRQRKGWGGDHIGIGNAAAPPVLRWVSEESGDPMKLIPAVRKAIAEIDSGLPISNIQLLDELSGAGLGNRRTYVLGLGLFASVATLLAAIGIYGLMAYSVARRTREIGVRMALGAGMRQVIVNVGARAVVLIAAGLAAGVAGSLGLTRMLATQLWGVTPTDPATFAGVSAFLALVALAACWVPARRAIQIDPAVTLRAE
jgi:putative ABC transport system permease protein